MKIYRISATAKPPRGKFQYYAQLDCKKSDESFLWFENFNGKPFPKPWRRVKLHFNEPLWPRADFYYFGSSKFVCTERAKVEIGSLMEKSGALLPVTIEGEDAAHYIYHVSACHPCVNPVKSIWEHDSDEPDDPVEWNKWKARKLKEGWRDLKSLKVPAFDPRKVGRNAIFVIPEKPFEIYCVERTADPTKGELKALVEQHKLAGLRFELAWSEARGPVPDECPPVKGSDFVWKTGEGKNYRAK